MKRDLREYARQTRFRMIAGGLALFFLVAEVLLYFIFGDRAALGGLICMGAALLPVVIIILVLQVLEWIVKKNREE